MQVTRKARRGRWFFFVQVNAFEARSSSSNIDGQMIGSAAEVARFGVTMIVFRFPIIQSTSCCRQFRVLVFKQCSF